MRVSQEFLEKEFALHIDGVRDEPGGKLLKWKNFEVTKAKVYSLNLEHAELIDCRFEDSDFSGSILIVANLSGTNFTGADLFGADLDEANLKYANLSYTNLEEANLEGADLRGAIITGANLKGHNLEELLLRGAIWKNRN